MRRPPLRRRHLFRDDAGAAAVEFAIILPVLLMILTGVIEFGRAMWVRASIQYACEEAARYAITHPSITMAALAAQAKSALPIALIGAEFSAATSTAGGLNYVQVSGSVPFEPVLPLLGVPQITLTGSSKVPF